MSGENFNFVLPREKKHLLYMRHLCILCFTVTEKNSQRKRHNRVPVKKEKKKRKMGYVFPAGVDQSQSSKHVAFLA